MSEAALAVCIREIRQALGDNPRTPRFIETVQHGRGYRFMAAVTVADRLPASPSLAPASPLLVGREVECAQMQRWWAKAVQGERQVGFVTGEAAHWQDHPGGGLHSARGGRWGAGDRSRAVHRTVWGWRRLSASAGASHGSVGGLRARTFWRS